MTTFDDSTEFSGQNADQTFSIKHLSHDRWSLTVTGVKDLETGEQETTTDEITSLEAIAVFGCWLNASQSDLFGLQVAFDKILKSSKLVNHPEHLKLFFLS